MKDANGQYFCRGPFIGGYGQGLEGAMNSSNTTPFGARRPLFRRSPPREYSGAERGRGKQKFGGG